MQTDIDPRSLIGRKAFDRNGAKIGTVDEVYLDDATGEPEWAAVRTGLFGRDAFVPLEPSVVVDDALRIPYERSLIKDAPDFGVGRHLSPEQELQLYHHYGLTLPTPEGPGRAGSPASPSSGELGSAGGPGG
ncbi:PRC-barrel domain-containing protein [Streptomyces stramineus]|uniref:PRC-barrel domain-containing protein n=1 Tax=Streptomyces TaxID=1883 RepID=UPI0031DA081C